MPEARTLSSVPDASYVRVHFPLHLWKPTVSLALELLVQIYTQWEIGAEKERPEIWTSRVHVRAALENGQAQILDARAEVQYTGKQKQ